MEGTYPVWFGNEEVGKVTVRRQGLYYCFECNCEVRSEVICKVTLSIQGYHESLGILVPLGNGFVLRKKLPIKHVKQGAPEFWITPKHAELTGTYVDIYPEEPFCYIARLERAYLDKRRGKVGIFIPDI